MFIRCPCSFWITALVCAGVIGMGQPSSLFNGQCFCQLFNDLPDSKQEENLQTSYLFYKVDAKIRIIERSERYFSWVFISALDTLKIHILELSITMDLNFNEFSYFRCQAVLNPWLLLRHPPKNVEWRAARPRRTITPVTEQKTVLKI